MTQATSLDVLWEPLQVGTMALKNRIMVPTHGAGVGNILGSDRQAASFRAYYVGRARGGAAWVGGSNCFVLNPLIPGFEPTGVGATTDSNFRNPLFLERYGRYADELHGEGAFGTLQMILMGGMPHGPTGGRQSSWATNVMPHEMEPHEIEQLIEEYGYSAGRALEARLDGLEIHANHDDVVQWFLSPLTNQREDDYGGSVENRLRMLLEINRAIRAAVGNGLTLGVRLCMDEMIRGRVRPRRGSRDRPPSDGERRCRLLQLRRRRKLGRPQLHPTPPLRTGRVGAHVGRAEGGNGPARRLRRTRHRCRGGGAGARRWPRRCRRPEPRDHRRPATPQQGARRPPRRGTPLHRHQRLHPPWPRRWPSLRLRGQPERQP